MNDSVVSQALIDLEKSLKEIDSAKKQVVSVTDQSQEIIKAFKEVLKTLTSVQKDFEKQGGIFSDRAEVFRNDLSEKLQQSLEDMVVVQTDNEKQLEARFDELIKEVELHTKSLSSFNAEVEKAQQKLGSLAFDHMFERVVERLNKLEGRLEESQNQNHHELHNKFVEELLASEARQLTSQNKLFIALIVGFVLLMVLNLF